VVGWGDWAEDFEEEEEGWVCVLGLPDG